MPELSEVRKEIVEFWKRQQAFVAAKAEAKSIADDANGAKPLADSLDDKSAERVFETLDFSWMTHGAVPGGMAPPTISEVMVDGGGEEGVDERVEMAGRDFMEAVFALTPGEVGVAANQPQTMVYVARMISETPPKDERKQNFLQSGVSMDTYQIAAGERQQLLRKWYEDLEQEFELKWKRTPEFFGR